MSMMCPPHRVKTVSTPSFFSALATRCPPEITLASRDLRLSVSSAVVVPLPSVVLVAVSSMDPPFVTLNLRRQDSRHRSVAPRNPWIAPDVVPERAPGALPPLQAEGRDPQRSMRRKLRSCTNGGGPIRVGAAHGPQDQNGHQRRQDVEDGGRDEYRVPVSF